MSPATRVVLVRHAQSRMNLRPDLVGGRSLHTPLSDEGRRAALERGRELASLRPNALYCTTALRSRQTAECLDEGAGWGLPVQVEDGLVELSQGSAEGGVREQWWTPQAVEAMRADPRGHRLAPDGENHAEVQERVLAALGRLHAAHPGGCVVAVSHGVAMRSLLWHLAGTDHDWFRACEMPNLAAVELVVDGGGVRVSG